MIIIQSNDNRTIPHHFDCSTVLYGALDSGQKYRLTSFDEIKAGKMDALLPNHLAVGSVEFMQEVFSRLNIIPLKLPRNSNRISEEIFLHEAIKRTQNGEKLFIKPKQTKLFTGFVLDRSIYSCLHGLPENTQILAYTPFESDIVTEWRIYVCKNKIYDMKNYSGDFSLIPSFEYAQSILDENKVDFPSTYTIDIGILESGENVVIEFNDMYAIGNYGVRNDIYIFMLKERYFEILKKSQRDYL